MAAVARTPFFQRIPITQKEKKKKEKEKEGKREEEEEDLEEGDPMKTAPVILPVWIRQRRRKR